MDTIGGFTDQKTNILLRNSNICYPGELYRPNSEAFSEGHSGLPTYQKRLKIGLRLLYDPIKRFKPFAGCSDVVAGLHTTSKIAQ